MKAFKKALIIGVSGQDGSYLAKRLSAKGYRVYGTSRNHRQNLLDNFSKIGVASNVRVSSMSLMDKVSVKAALAEYKPDEVYNLSGPSSVGRSFKYPQETKDQIVTGTKNLLEVLREIGEPTRFLNVTSSECFGETSTPASEDTAFNPVSPYALAKAEAFSLVKKYRKQYGLSAYSGIFFNHESPLRPLEFVTQKIINGAFLIADGRKTKLVLGNLNVIRDWGWAPEYVEAMWKILQAHEPDDFVIATGKSFSLRDVVTTAFSQFHLDWRDFVETDDKFMRPTDIAKSMGNPNKAASVLGWKAKTTMPGVISRMIKFAKFKQS